MKAITGTILAFAPRPKPNAERKLCQASAATIRRPAQARAVVALVAEVVDDPAGGRGPGAWESQWASAASISLACRAGAAVVAEDLLDLVAPLLQAAQRQAERGDGVADRVVGVVAGDGDEQGPLERPGAQAAAGEFRAERVHALVDLDEERLAGPGEAVDRVGPQQPARLDRDEAVADPLDLAEQVAGDHDGDAELRRRSARSARASRSGPPGPGRSSARRAAAAAGRPRGPGRASPAASCRWSRCRSAGSAPRAGRRGAATRRHAPWRRSPGGRTCGPCA